MPWKESHRVNERMHFVSRLKRDESMSDLCHEYGISRKTGYKFLERLSKKSPEGLTGRIAEANYIAASNVWGWSRLSLLVGSLGAKV